MSKEFVPEIAKTFEEKKRELIATEEKFQKEQLGTIQYAVEGLQFIVEKDKEEAQGYIGKMSELYHRSLSFTTSRNPAFQDYYTTLQLIGDEIRLNMQHYPEQDLHDNIVIKSYFDNLRDIIEKNEMDINFKTRTGYFPLSVASLTGDVGMMQFLIDKGADMSMSAESSGYAMLHFAITSRNPIATVFAIEAIGKSPDKIRLMNQRDHKGIMPLAMAVINRTHNRTSLDMMLLSGVTIPSVEQAFTNVPAHNPDATIILKDHMRLLEGMKEEDREINCSVFRLIKLYELKGGYKNYLNATATDFLDQAITSNTDYVMELTKSSDPSKANAALKYIIDVVTNLKQMAALEFIRGREDLAKILNDDLKHIVALGVRLITENHADPNMQGDDGDTIKHHLAHFDMVDGMTALCAREGVMLTERNRSDMTVLHANCIRKKPACLATILEKEPTLINQKDKDGNTALHLLAKHGDFFNVATLINKKADCTLSNNQGETILHLLSKAQKPPAKLIEQLARFLPEDILKAEDNQGSSALNIATCAGAREIVTILRTEINKKGTLSATKSEVEIDPAEQINKIQRDLNYVSRRDRFDPNLLRRTVASMQRLDLDVNLKGEGGVTAAHIAATFDQHILLDDLLSKGANIGLKDDAGSTVMQLIMDKHNVKGLKAVVKHHHGDIEDMSALIKSAIETGVPQMLCAITKDERIIQRFSELDEDGHSVFKKDRFVSGSKALTNTIPNKRNRQEMKAVIDRFVEAIDENQSKKAPAVEVIAEPTLSKNQRKKRKQEARKLRIAQEEEEAQQNALRRAQKEVEKQRQKEEEQLQEAAFIRSEVAQVIADTQRKVEEAHIRTQVKECIEDQIQGVLSQFEPSRMQFVPGSEAFDASTTDESLDLDQYEDYQDISCDSDDKELKSDVESLSSPVIPGASSRLSASAQVFVPASQQISEFLNKDRSEINSFSDLPPFLQPKIAKLLTDGYKVLLRGSSVNRSKKHTDRLPADLDIKIIGKKYMDGDNQKSKDFFRDYFGLEIADQDIYRGPGQDRSDFTAHGVDDKHRLDISLYDKRSPSQFTWLDSIEKEVLFTKQPNGHITTRKVRPVGLTNYVNYYNIKIPHDDVMFNPDARSLVLISTFRKTINGDYGGRYDLFRSMSLCSSDLLSKELKMDQDAFIFAENDDKRQAIIEKGLRRFITAHKMDEKLQYKFLSNIANVISDTRNIRTQNPQRLEMMLEVINNMQHNLSAKSPQPNISQASTTCGEKSLSISID